MMGVSTGGLWGTVRVDNHIGDAGAASLAPSLGRMTQLTALDLGGALVCIGGSCAVSGCLRPPAVHGELGVLRAEAVVCGALAGGGGLQAAGRGALLCAANEIGDDGAALLAPSLGRMAQLTSLDLGGTLRASALAAL